MSPYLGPFESVEITVAASDKVAIFSTGRVDVFEKKSYVNYPSTKELFVQVNNTEYVSAAFAAAATLLIQAGSAGAYYEYGTAPVIQTLQLNPQQPTPGTLNATGTLTAALVFTGIVTSTTAAAVVATLDTGAIMDNAGTFAVDDSFDWSVINTGANAFTVTAAASGHTVVGAGAVAAGTSGNFRTRKTAADTFVTYRIG